MLNLVLVGGDPTRSTRNRLVRSFGDHHWSDLRETRLSRPRQVVQRAARGKLDGFTGQQSDHVQVAARGRIHGWLALQLRGGQVHVRANAARWHKASVYPFYQNVTKMETPDDSTFVMSSNNASGLSVSTGRECLGHYVAQSRPGGE